VSRLDVAENGSDLLVPVHFSPLLQANASMFLINIFPNETAPGAPAYEFLALTIHRYTGANFSFQAPGPINEVYPNLTGYLMSPPEFGAFIATGNATRYVLASGNVSSDTRNLTFSSGTWYFVMTGWAVDEHRSVGFHWTLDFPRTELCWS